MKRTFNVLAIILLIAIVASCTPDGKQRQSASMDEKYLIADTIAYPVRIKNINPDDEWADVRLKKLNRKKLVDDIFKSIYDGKATAYNYLTDKAYQIQDIKEMEGRDDFTRDNVVELEFREIWWYNGDKSIFKKKVISILVAYAVFEEGGNLRSMKAGFYIKMNAE